MSFNFGRQSLNLAEGLEADNIHADDKFVG
jgi:hypothetical protein